MSRCPRRSIHRGGAVRQPSGPRGVRGRAATPTSAGRPTDGRGEPATPAETPVINFAAYSTPREVYGKIIPAFVSQWKEDHDDQNVIFQESYAGSTTQAANIIARLRGRRRGAVPRTRRRPDRRRRPDHARLDRRDRRRDGLDVGRRVRRPPRQPARDSRTGTTWPPRASRSSRPTRRRRGGARWNLVSAWGSALRGHAGVTEGDEAGAQALLEGVLGNVSCSTRAPATRSRTSRPATATSRSRTRTRCSRRRRPASRTRRSTRRRAS